MFATKAITENIVQAKVNRKELEVSNHLESILTKVNSRLLNKLSRLFEGSHTCKNFINASSYNFTALEIGILNMGPKHVFREDFQVCDIVSFFEKASWV